MPSANCPGAKLEGGIPGFAISVPAGFLNWIEDCVKLLLGNGRTVDMCPSRAAAGLRVHMDPGIHVSKLASAKEV